MGNVWSTSNIEQPPQEVEAEEVSNNDNLDEFYEKRKRERAEEMERFKKELAKKRETRQLALATLSREVRDLRRLSEEEKAKRMMAEAALEGIASAEPGKEVEGLKKLVEELRCQLTEEKRRREAAEVEAEELKKKLAEPEEARTVKEMEELKQVKDEEKRAEVEAEGFEQGQNGSEGDRIAEEMEELRKEVNEEKEKRAAAEAALSQNSEKMEALNEKVAKTEELENQVQALKDVASIGKQILTIREKQVNELNAKLKVIEATGAEYEKEVANIRRLRSLYEERERANAREQRVALERERARLVVAETRLGLSQQALNEAQERSTELGDKVKSLDSSLSEARNQVSELRIQLATVEEQLYHANSHLRLINNLFSQILAGPETDFDRLARLLEDNHALINELTAKGQMNEVAGVLLETAKRADEEETGGGVKDEAKTVAENLAKVWRVLVELLSHHKDEPGNEEDGVQGSCYKSVETPSGTKTVISVSSTFLRLRNLILEKNSLVKEVGRLKTLNSHLETRLDKQEKRLSLVTTELHATWAVVSKLRNQHKQLHTQEKILRYELKHKRHMLTELKKELEICREQWEMARVKNSQTEEDWKLLRQEFAMRKQTQSSSTESGYEDEDAQSPPSEEITDSQDEEGVEEEVALMDSEEGKHKNVYSEERIVEGYTTEKTLNMNESITEEEKTNVTDNFSEMISKEEKTVSEDNRSNADNPLEISLQTDNDDEKGTEEMYDKTIDGITESSSDRNESTDNNRADILSSEFSSSEELLAPPPPQPPPSNESAEGTCSSEQQQASTSSQRPRTAEEVLQGREARLRRLEEQCKSLFNRMSNTSIRSDIISSRLEELHEQYGEPNNQSQDQT